MLGTVYVKLSFCPPDGGTVGPLDPNPLLCSLQYILSEGHNANPLDVAL